MDPVASATRNQHSEHRSLNHLFNLFIQIIMEYLKANDRILYVKAELVQNECRGKYLGNVTPGYESLTLSLHNRFRGIIPPHHWENSKTYFKNYLIWNYTNNDGLNPEEVQMRANEEVALVSKPISIFQKDHVLIAICRSWNKPSIELMLKIVEATGKELILKKSKRGNNILKEAITGSMPVEVISKIIDIGGKELLETMPLIGYFDDTNPFRYIQ